MKLIRPIIPLTNSAIAQAAIILFHVLLMLKSYVGTDNELLAKIFTASSISIGLLVTFRFRLKANSLILLFITLMILFACAAALLGPNYRVNDIILVFNYFGIALIPVYYTLNHKVFLWFAYIIALFFVPFIISGADSNYVFNINYASRNYISCVLLIGLAYHIISCFQNDKRPNFILITLSLIIAIWAVGRGGIIAIGFIWISYPFMLKIKVRHKILIFMLIAISSLVAFYIFKDVLLQYGLGRFKSMGMGGAREDINADYLQATFHSFRNFLFGCPLNEIPAIVALGIDPNLPVNPHNAFIRIHVYYGLGGLVLLIFMLTFSAYKFFRARNYLLLVLLMSLLARSAVDSISFHGPFDTIIYALLFLAIKNYRVKYNSSKIKKCE
jgi:hypothetical protein